MKFFLDSAKIDEIREARDTFGIDGVTTNPKHVMNSGKPFLTVVNELAAEFKGHPDFPISVEINPHLETAADIVDGAEKIARISENFVIKIPCTNEGLCAARKLEAKGVRTNVTLVFSASQAIVPGKIKAKYVSPFVGWKEDSGDDGLDYVRDIVQIYRTYGFDTEIIVAAVRNGYQIGEAAKAGADIVTAGLAVFRASFEHAFTAQGLGVFQNAWDNTVTD
ncbi:Transaldolase [Coriobacterium glomerans PW2]|uniref:Transaldolase n=1 Tax=Coriobacterium glomerans (strain ATCC 49209 / DSM 20642 / JCM 10262 / PW2) TaxID=700015 RepID=F2N819_CORGP|nr:transaldolase family protein [Coriobacterium glomerans]AEB07202.1 Transaldolase [Coriobacterium glomerans PW2]